MDTNTEQPAPRARSTISLPLRNFLTSHVFSPEWHTKQLFSGADLVYLEWLESYEKEICPDMGAGRWNNTQKWHRSGDETPQEGGWATLQGCGCGNSSPVVPYSLAVEWAETDSLEGKKAIVDGLPRVPGRDPRPNFDWHAALNHAAFFIYRLQGAPWHPALMEQEGAAT